MNVAPKYLLRTVSFFVIILSLCLAIVCISLVWQRIRPAKFTELTRLTSFTKKSTTPNFIPSFIKIDKQEIAVAVEPGQISDGKWTISDDVALSINVENPFQQYSAEKINSSTIIIYGHNYLSIFDRLKGVVVDDEIVLADQQGQTLTFVVTDTEVVKPSAINALIVRDTTDLVVYTCTSFLDSQRFIVRAQLKK